MLSAVFLIPLLGAFGNFGYEQIKALFFLLSISLMGFLWMGKGIKWTGISKAGGLFVLILLFTSLTGINPKSSLLGKEPYFQSWILYAYFYLLYLLVKQTKVELKQYGVALSLSALLISFSAIKDWVLLNILNIQVPSYAGRVISTFGQPNFYAGFLLLTLPFTYLLFKSLDKRLRYLGEIAGVVSMVGILVSYSRFTILLALILFSVGLMLELKFKFKLGLIFFGIILISVVAAWRFSSGFIGQEVSLPIATNNPDLTKESVEKRAYIWPVAWQVILEKPVLGYGLENINYAFSNYFLEFKHQLFEENLKVYPVFISLKDLNIDRTHNYILDLLLFSGPLGLVFWVILVLLLFKKLLQKYYDRDNNVLLVSLVVYLIWVQFQNQSIVQLVYFWVLAGLIDS